MHWLLYNETCGPSQRTLWRASKNAGTLADHPQTPTHWNHSVVDLQEELKRILDDPLLASQLVRDHETTIQGLYSAFGKNRKPGRKSKHPDPETFPPPVLQLQKHLDGVKLRSWKWVLPALSIVVEFLDTMYRW